MRRDRLIRSLATLLPEPIAAAPERVLINFSVVLIGIAALLSERPGSLLALWPWWVAVEWALVMAGGGLAALVGYWKRQTTRGEMWGSLERVGYLAILLASLLYGVGVIVVFGWQGAFGGAIYLGIAFAKAVRLVVTSAARSELTKPGAESGDGR